MLNMATQGRFVKTKQVFKELSNQVHFSLCQAFLIFFANVDFLGVLIDSNHQLLEFNGHMIMQERVEISKPDRFINPYFLTH